MITNDIQLLCNGKKFAIIYCHNNEQYATIINNPVVKSVSQTLDREIQPRLYPAIKSPTFVDFGRRTIDVDISFVGSNYNIAYGKDLMLDIDMFDNHTINELFKMISRRIDTRK